MEPRHGTADPDTTARLRRWLGITLLGVGLLGHLLAAQAIGGYYIAYRDHIVGFLLLTTITGVIVAGLGWRFWRGCNDITLLTLGGVQALLGFVIWLNRFNIH